MSKEIIVDGVTYIPKHKSGPPGKLTCVVLESGWVFIGVLDPNTPPDNSPFNYEMIEVRNVRRWKNGFGALTRGKLLSEAVLDEGSDIQFMSSQMRFAVPLPENWETT